MTSDSNDLKKALQENLKLRRELATEVAEAKGEKFAAVRLHVTRMLGAFRYAVFGRVRSAPVSASARQLDLTKRPMTPDYAREQRIQQLGQLDAKPDPGECRQRALECVRLAQTTRDSEAKRIWSDLAKTWLTFAADLEANECLFDEWGKPQERGKKSPG